MCRGLLRYWRITLPAHAQLATEMKQIGPQIQVNNHSKCCSPPV